MRPCTRTETVPVLSADPSVRPGEAVVADEVVRPGRSPFGLPAAALVAGALRRRGVPASRGRVLAAPAPAGSGGAATLLLARHASVHGSARDGRLAAAVAVMADDAASQAAARSVLDAVERAIRPRTVLLASPRSFCAGVERAIEIVERVLEQRGAPVYVRKQIVHNVHVVADLRRRGAVFVEELDEVPDGATVVFSAHGVSPAVRATAEESGLDVIDATCPLVTKVHVEARRFADRSDTVVFIGHAGHEETEGTLGEAPHATVLVEDVSDVSALRVPDPTRVSYLTQTTLAVDETAEIVEALRRRFPALRGPGSDDICYATTNRQEALRGVADEADLLLVVGSRNSSNSLRLVELGERQGTPARLIDDASDIDLDWLASAGTVGLTAGASAPPSLVDEVVATLGGLGPVTVRERRVTEETMRFAMPRKVRDR